MKIRLCHHNQGADQLLQRLQTEQPRLDSKLKKCAKQCKICRRQPFALYDKQLLTAADMDELYTKLLEKVVSTET